MAKDKEFKMPTREELRARGYMTADEFIERFVPGLRDYLRSNWGSRDMQLFHPEDLATNAAIYTEIAYRVIADFGAQPSE